MMQAISTLLVAIALGFVVQYGETDPMSAEVQPRPVYNKAPKTLMLATNSQGEPVFGMPTPTSYRPEPYHLGVISLSDIGGGAFDFTAPEMAPILATPSDGCDVEFDARRLPVAMVELTISAPCHGSRAMVALHAGLEKPFETDDAGMAVVEVPAITPRAVFALEIDNIRYADLDIFVPEVRKYDRLALTWRTKENLQLHAFEGEATVGEAGHIWSASIHSPDDAVTGLHGFVMGFGTGAEPRRNRAEVYTYPAGRRIGENWADVRVGVRVSDENCNRQMDVTLIELSNGQIRETPEALFTVPDCENVGETAMIPWRSGHSG